MNRRGFFAAVVAVPGIVKAKPAARALIRDPRLVLKYRLNARYGKFADPTPGELAQDERNKRHNAEVMRSSYYGSRCEFFLAT